MPGGRAPPARMMPYLHQHVLEAGTKEVCGRASGTALHATPFPKEGETANEAKENTAKPWRTTRSVLIRPRTQSMLSFISSKYALNNLFPLVSKITLFYKKFGKLRTKHTQSNKCYPRPTENYYEYILSALPVSSLAFWQDRLQFLVNYFFVSHRENIILLCQTVYKKRHSEF